MSRLIPIFCAAAMVGGAAVAQTAEAEDTARTVEVELREGNRLVATPTVRVELGRPAAVSVGDYSLRFRMDRADGEGPYVIRSSLYRSDGGWARVTAPTLTVLQGERARARFAGGDGAQLSLAVTVR